MPETPPEPASHRHVSNTEWIRLQAETRRHRDEADAAEQRAGLGSPDA